MAPAMRHLALALVLASASAMAATGCVAAMDDAALEDDGATAGGKGDDPSAAAPVRVVVSGFAPFLDYRDNESGEVARRLAQDVPAGLVVEHHILEVSPAAIDAFVDEMQALRPAVVISLGYEGLAQLEERPENILHAGSNGVGAEWAGRAVVEGGPAELGTDLPTAVVDGALAGFGWRRTVRTARLDRDYEPTHDGYVCNYLAYRLAHAFGPDADVAAGFFHVDSRRVTDQLRAVMVAVAAHQRDR
jgi:pyroglutamyl-peptidase